MEKDQVIEFGRFKLVGLIGEGGMAKVYRGILSGPMGFEKICAIKRIDPKYTSDERFVRGLINEARLGGMLRHPNIVEIYEFGNVGREYYMAMELVDGWTMDHVLKVGGTERPMPAKAALECMMLACEGLEFAHTLSDHEGAPMNLVHRDLKPGNIIVSTRGQAKLLDFGIAKSDANLFQTTEQDATKGTPVYMSPEQVTADPVDRRSDIFAMGSILFELITGEPVFRADNLLGVLHRILEVEVREAPERLNDLVPGLDEVLMRCLARNVEGRYDSAKELGQALKPFLLSRPSEELGLSDFIDKAAPSLPPLKQSIDIARDKIDLDSAMIGPGEATIVGGGLGESPGDQTIIQPLPEVEEKPKRRAGKPPPLPKRVMLDAPRLNPPPRFVGGSALLSMLSGGPTGKGIRRMVRVVGLLLLLSAATWSIDVPWSLLGREGYAKVLAKQELHPLSSKPWASDRMIRRLKIYRMQITLPMPDGGVQSVDLKVPSALYQRLDVGEEFVVQYPEKLFPSAWVRPVQRGSSWRELLFLPPLICATLLLFLIVFKGRKQLVFLPFYRKGLEATATVTEFSIQRVMVGKYPVGRLYQLRYDLQVAKGRFQGVHTDAFVEEFLPLYKGRLVSVLYDPEQPWKSIPVAFLPRALRGRASGVARAEGE